MATHEPRRPAPATYARRTAEETVLYEVVRDQIETFLSQALRISMLTELTGVALEVFALRVKEVCFATLAD